MPVGHYFLQGEKMKNNENINQLLEEKDVAEKKGWLAERLADIHAAFADKEPEPDFLEVMGNYVDMAKGAYMRLRNYIRKGEE